MHKTETEITISPEELTGGVYGALRVDDVALEEDARIKREIDEMAVRGQTKAYLHVDDLGFYSNTTSRTQSGISREERKKRTARRKTAKHNRKK